jgi:hypothetical protein
MSCGFVRFGAVSGSTPSHHQTSAALAADETTGVDQRQVQSEENADESAKMGEKSGTQSGDEGAAPENDTKKVDQSPRQNPTTNN